MKLIEEGNIVKLSDGRDYLAFSVINDDSRSFIYFMSVTQPVEIFFAEQSISDGNLNVRILRDKLEKEAALELFTRSNLKQ